MIYYFNPDTEMALREGESSFYIAPAPVRQMARDLALLPLWLAGEGDGVLVEELPPSGFMEQLHALFPWLKLPALLTPKQLHSLHSLGEKASCATASHASCTTAGCNLLPFTPWGWNPTLFAKLHHWGVSCPEEEATAPLRYALGNKSNLQLLDNQLMALGLSSARHRHFTIHSVGEAEELLTHETRLFSHGLVLKEGYSSSGRGHRWCRPTYSSQASEQPLQLLTPELRQWILRRTARGEAIDMEPLYDKVADLALLFHLAPGEQASTLHVKQDTPLCKASFTGYSLFETTPEGAYRSNLLASDEALLAHLGERMDTTLIEEAKQTFLRLLEEQYPTLSGPIGIDMMIYREADSGTLTLHPDVEVNPRPTMGLVARRLYDRLLSPSLSPTAEGQPFPSRTSEGQPFPSRRAEGQLSPTAMWRFVVEGSASSAQLQQRHDEDLLQHPLRCDAHGHPLSGYLPLTPIQPDTRFRAYIIR